MVKMCKKLGLSVVLAGMFGASANAACDSIFCIGGNVGIGGIYTDFGGNNRADGDFKGSYGALDLDLIVIRRLLFSLNLKGGSGSMGVYGPDFTNNLNGSLLGGNVGAFAATHFKIGFNVASLESPLYVSFIGGVDGYAGAFGYGLVMYGAELQGKKSFGGRTSLLYSFGGGAANSVYAFAQDKAETANGSTGDVGYSLFGSLGVDIGMTRNLGFYIKAIAKYYNIPQSSPVQINNQTITLPHANAWTTMLETGLRF